MAEVGKKIFLGGIYIIITTILIFLSNIKTNWWILGWWGIISGFGIICFVIYLVLKSRKSIPELPSQKNTSKVVVTKEECEEYFKKTLLKPEYSNMITEIIDNYVENIGTESITPINIIVAECEYDKDRYLEFYQVTNMTNPLQSSILRYTPKRYRSREDFDRRLKDLINKTAEIPERIKIKKRLPRITEAGQLAFEEVEESMDIEQVRKKQEEEEELKKAKF